MNSRFAPYLVGISCLFLICSCSRNSLDWDSFPDHESEVLAQDLDALAIELTGQRDLDIHRLQLVEGQFQPLRELAGYWLLHLHGSTGQRMVCLRAGEKARLLAAGDSLEIVEEIKARDPDDARLLVLERDRAAFRLVQTDLQGGRRVLAAGSARDLHWSPEPPALLLPDKEQTPLFRESPGSCRLEQIRPLIRDRKGWSLGKAQVLDSPYRCLNDFLLACRNGKWKKAKELSDPSRLLALPNGGYSSHFKASLKLSLPRLMQTDLMLEAPRPGSFSMIEDLAGKGRWRVEFDQLPRDGQNRWVLTRLERVLQH